MKSENFFTIFIGISVVYLTFIVFGRDDVSWFIKPLLLPFLLLSVYKFGSFNTKNWLISALFFSWIGDVILLFADKGELYFIFGLVSFLIAHLLFIILFIKQNSEKIHKKKTLYWVGFILVLAYLLGMLLVLIPKLGSLKFAVGIYAITISLMLLQSIKGCFDWKKKAKYLILIGAIFFVSSDSILAINKFHSPLSNASFFIMITYLIAQFFITFGILKLNKKNSISE
jgi:uncharacterized membrane protein YhhN